MKFCVAQTCPAKGDIQRNIDRHLQLIALAVSNRADTIIFPELSLTGYEPELAANLATTPDDSRFAVFQEISDTRTVTLGIGMPIRTEQGICISLVIFQPGKSRQLYSKKYLHPDEEPFFISGQNAAGLFGERANIALAICYELSVPEHSENVCRNGAEIYIASVAKSVTGVGKALITLSGIASRFGMPVLMANCTGHCDNFDCGGKSSIWNDKGELVGQLDDTQEGILIYDADARTLINKTL